MLHVYVEYFIHKAPSAPLAPSTSFEIARDLIDQLAVYSRRRPKRNIKTPFCGTH